MKSFFKNLMLIIIKDFIITIAVVFLFVPLIVYISGEYYLLTSLIFGSIIMVLSTLILSYHTIAGERNFKKYLKSLLLNSIGDIIPIITLFIFSISWGGDVGFYWTLGLEIISCAYVGAIVIMGILYFLIAESIEKKFLVRNAAGQFNITRIIFLILIISILSLLIAQSFSFTINLIEENKKQKRIENKIQYFKEHNNVLEAIYIPAIFREYDQKVDSGGEFNLDNYYFCDKKLFQVSRDIKNENGYLLINQYQSNEKHVSFEKDNSYIDYQKYFLKIESGNIKTVNIRAGNTAYYQEGFYKGSLIGNKLFWFENKNNMMVSISSYEKCLQPIDELIKIANSMK